MNNLITILTITNTVLIIYILITKTSKYRMHIDKTISFYNKKIIGYDFIIWEKTSEYPTKFAFKIYVPIRNRRKTELEEELEMLKIRDNMHVMYVLSMKFSYIKTWEDVNQFKYDYGKAYPKIVSDLISNFIPK